MLTLEEELEPIKTRLLKMLDQLFFVLPLSSLFVLISLLVSVSVTRLGDFKKQLVTIFVIQRVQIFGGFLGNFEKNNLFTSILIKNEFP